MDGESVKEVFVSSTPGGGGGGGSKDKINLKEKTGLLKVTTKMLQ